MTQQITLISLALAAACAAVVLFPLRDDYATDPELLIAASQVIAIHFQTIAEANGHWR